MNLGMEKNVNFNIILMLVLKNKLDLDFLNGFSTTHFGPP